MRQWQDLMFGHRHSFTRMLNPHYSELAKAYNIPYALVTDRKDLEAKVNTMLSTEGPFFLECAVKENENILPMVVPGTSVDEMVLHLIFNVLYAIKQRLMVDNKIAKESVKREVIAGERLYTLLVYSENVAGVLNQIAAVLREGK